MILLLPSVTNMWVWFVLYEQFMVGGNSSTRALDAALPNKLVNSILAGAYQHQPVRWDNRALYVKFWYYMLGQQVIDETSLILGAPATWVNRQVQFMLLGAAPALNAANGLVNNILSGSIVLLENVHFTMADLPVLYSLTMVGTRFNATAGALQFLFQSIQWPALSVTLVYHTVGAVPAPPANAHPPSADSWRFLLSLATNRGEIDDCIRGFYAASVIVGGHHVLHMLEASAAAATTFNPSQDPVPNMPCWCFLWQECYGQITMP